MKFIEWIDRRNFFSVRTFALYVSLLMLWEAQRWATVFASASDKTGSEVALIVTAATGPAVLLAGYVFNGYLGSRK